MNKDNCFFIGYFSKVIGHQGEVALRLDVDDPEKYDGLPLIFIQQNKRDHELVPFSIASFKVQAKSIARLKLTGVDDVSSSRALVGKEAFLPLDMLPPLSGSQFYYHEVINFKVIDKVEGDIGTIIKVLEYPNQAVLEIKHPSGKEVLIPINDHTIEAVDRAHNTLQVIAPEGLIDLYLNDG